MPPVKSHPVVRITLRVVFTALAVFSCGTLSWLALLRIAILRGRRGDWIAFWASLALVVCAFWTFSVGDTSEQASGVDYVGLLILFSLALGVPAYYLTVDIRLHRTPKAAPAPQPRIAAVQAELDELSDLLRRDQDGRR
ncbi:hypothetical protein SRB5_70520 [Streptomyces sp. RB5]|uniref:Integral membrane protein n=1 Tax=Streptomyces smaragdinus TaxID=2585196 RepID=A0A7K0CTQ5_9ACTN|nr:hypothetical protein [Streptomyces smaragdinus]MQY16849.1 hypothetical protein [Streptomyces smaragdinus]